MADEPRHVPGPADPATRKAMLEKALAGDSGKPRSPAADASGDHEILRQLHGALGNLLNSSNPRQPTQGGKTVDQAVDEAIAGAPKKPSDL